MKLRKTLCHSWFLALACACAGLVGRLSAPAQVPAAVAGSTVVSKATDGLFPFATNGFFLFAPADTGNTYQLVGFKGVLTSQGIYSYALTNATQAALTLTDSVVGVVLQQTTYLTPASGLFYSMAVATNGFQKGTFEIFLGQAPDSAAGLAFIATAEDGAYPFGTGGTFSFAAASSGTNYTVLGNGLNGSSRQGSLGTYAYAKLNRSTATLQISDSVSGNATLYLCFSNAFAGFYAVKGAGGFQVGHFSPVGFLRQPVDQIVRLGGTASFQVTAGGGTPFSYQWRLNGVPIAGATQSSYSTNNVQLRDSGSQFSCLVTNLYGARLSQPATLTVTTNRVLTLLAPPLWTNTTLPITQGQPVTIRAAGRWVWSGATSVEFGPDGDPLDQANGYDLFYSQALHGALLAYVGTDPYQGHWGDRTFFPQTNGYWNIGRSNQFTSPVSGDLWLGFNDDAATKAVEDNEGSLTVELVGVNPLVAITLKVVGLSPATITVSAAGGYPGAAFRLLSSPGMGTPRSAWAVAGSGSFDAGGNATLNLPRNPAGPQSFYLLTSP